MITIHVRLAVVAALPALLSVPTVSQDPPAAAPPTPVFVGAQMQRGSNPMGLLRHPEVQSHIALSLRQRQRIEELRGKSMQDLAERMRQTFQGARGAPGQGREDRQKRMEEMQQNVRAQMESSQGDLTKQMEEILRPEQVARLKELDLQYRGPMVLADPRVADQIKIAPNTRVKIAEITTEYTRTSNELRSEYMRDFMRSGGPQSGRVPDLTSKSSPLRRKTDPLKKDAEKRILTLLTPDELSRWEAAIGEKFNFRDPPPQDFTQFRRRGN